MERKTNHDVQSNSIFVEYLAFNGDALLPRAKNTLVRIYQADDILGTYPVVKDMEDIYPSNHPSGIVFMAMSYGIGNTKFVTLYQSVYSDFVAYISTLIAYYQILRDMDVPTKEEAETGAEELSVKLNNYTIIKTALDRVIYEFQQFLSYAGVGVSSVHEYDEAEYPFKPFRFGFHVDGLGEAFLLPDRFDYELKVLMDNSRFNGVDKPPVITEHIKEVINDLADLDDKAKDVIYARVMQEFN